jgi:hypothetical protein
VSRKRIFLVDGGGFTQTLIEWENPQHCMCLYITPRIFYLFKANMADQCIRHHIHNLASILNIFIQHLISGRGRYLTLLHLAEGELETLWEESLTIPTCLDCLDNIVILMDIVIRAYRVPRPQLHFNMFCVYYVIRTYRVPAHNCTLICI